MRQNLPACHELVGTDIVAGETRFGTPSGPAFAAETAEFCDRRGVVLTGSEAAGLSSALGGIPPLVASAVAVLHSCALSPLDADSRLTVTLERVVLDYVRQRLCRFGRQGRELCVTLGASLRVTAADAAVMIEATGSKAPDLLDCSRWLERFESEGLFFGRRDGRQRCWVSPAAVRTAMLTMAKEEIPGRVTKVLSTLAQISLERGDYADAAVYAVDAGDWTSAVQILAEHWSYLAINHVEMLARLVRLAPGEMVDDFPALASVKALFGDVMASHPFLQVPVPTDVEELIELGTGPDATRLLYIGTVQALAARVTGALRQGSERAATLLPLAESVLLSQPDAVSAQLSTLRLQWGICMQLAGNLSAATTQFECAYRDAVALENDLVALNAAGSIAVNWALLGELPLVDQWLAAEAAVDFTVDPWGEMIRVGGRVASVLAHLDRLDPVSAAPALDLLGIPTSTEELWGLCAYARAQYALATGDAYEGLTELHRTIAGHEATYQPGALAQILVTAAEIDLNLALGRGNRARALARADTTGHPLIVVAAARREVRYQHVGMSRRVRYFGAAD